MKKSVIKGALLGIAFTGLSYLIVRVLGFNSTSLTVLMYLYIILGVFAAIYFNTDIEDFSLSDFGNRIMFLVDEEEKKLKNVLTGEKYELRGELKKL